MKVFPKATFYHLLNNSLCEHLLSLTRLAVFRLKNDLLVFSLERFQTLLM